MLIAVGLPVKAMGKLYNCAAVMKDGEILAFVPKTHLPNYNEFYEARHFTSYCGGGASVDLQKWGGQDTRVAVDQTVFKCFDIPELTVGFEICEDLWAPDPVSNYLAKAGASIICNLSASNEVIGKSSTAVSLFQTSRQDLSAAIYTALPETANQHRIWVFSGHNLISEDGTILKESRLFENEITVSEIDVKKLAFERRKTSTYPESAEWSFYKKSENFLDDIQTEGFTLNISETALTRKTS